MTKLKIVNREVTTRGQAVSVTQEVGVLNNHIVSNNSTLSIRFMLQVTSAPHIDWSIEVTRQ